MHAGVYICLNGVAALDIVETSVLVVIMRFYQVTACGMCLFFGPRLGDEIPQAGGIKKFLRTGNSTTVGPSSLSRTAVGGPTRGGKVTLLVTNMRACAIRMAHFTPLDTERIIESHYSLMNGLE